MQSGAHRRTGAHGLPAEYRTAEGEEETWEAASGYLDALQRSPLPVVVAIFDPRLVDLNRGFKARLTQQIGFLRRFPVRAEHPHIHRFGVNWPDPDQPCGEFLVDERLFTGAGLSTLDGDDYFQLRVDLGPVSILVLDSNTNMDRAYNEWADRQHHSYLSLPSPREIEEKWRAEPNPDVIRKMRESLDALRVELVSEGATKAREMTDAELAAASERVSWTLRTSGRMTKVHHTEWRRLWIDELVANLREARS
jgi:hypothetical protein